MLFVENSLCPFIIFRLLSQTGSGCVWHRQGRSHQRFPGGLENYGHVEGLVAVCIIFYPLATYRIHDADYIWIIWAMQRNLWRHQFLANVIYMIYRSLIFPGDSHHFSTESQAGRQRSRPCARERSGRGRDLVVLKTTGTAWHLEDLWYIIYIYT